MATDQPLPPAQSYLPSNACLGVSDASSVAKFNSFLSLLPKQHGLYVFTVDDAKLYLHVNKAAILGLKLTQDSEPELDTLRELCACVHWIRHGEPGEAPYAALPVNARGLLHSYLGLLPNANIKSVTSRLKMLSTAWNKNTETCMPIQDAAKTTSATADPLCSSSQCPWVPAANAAAPNEWPSPLCEPLMGIRDALFSPHNPTYCHSPEQVHTPKSQPVPRSGYTKAKTKHTESVAWVGF